MKYSDLSEFDQPKHRITEVGAAALTTAELLATALWISDTETAQQLSEVYREAGSLAAIHPAKIAGIKGLGRSTSTAILAIAELARRETLASMPDRPSIRGPQDAADLVKFEMSALDHEELWVALLDTRNRIMKIVHLYKGTLNCSTVRVGEVFRDPVMEKAAGIILFHNHPSGDPAPSPEDAALTRAVVQAGKLMDIEVLDHLVIGKGRHTSLKEKGLGFS